MINAAGTNGSDCIVDGFVDSPVGDAVVVHVVVVHDVVVVVVVVHVVAVVVVHVVAVVVVHVVVVQVLFYSLAEESWRTSSPREMVLLAFDSSTFLREQQQGHFLPCSGGSLLP